MRSGRGAAALLVLAGLAVFAVGQARAAAPAPVNVVLILADDLGWGDLSCYGNNRFKTPNIDRLAAEGVRFTDFYSAAPYCAPSRAAMQTGRYPFRCGLTGNPVPKEGPAGGNERLDSLGLPPSEVTLAEAFRTAGYRTAMVGKWHLGHREQFRPQRQGYDEYLGILYSNDMHPVELIDGNRVAEYPVVQSTLTRRYAERCLDFIQRSARPGAGKTALPFFLCYTAVMPHKPLAASEAFYKKSGAGLYGDAVTELDWSVGQIVQRLRTLGLERNTLVLFTSDNGPWYGGSSGGLRGMKGQSWEGGIRVPLVGYWPGRIPAGRVRGEPGTLADLFPTCLSAAGVAPPKDRLLDGKDLLPLLTGTGTLSERPIFAMNGQRLATVRLGKWKLHAVPPGAPRDRQWDPDEKYVDPRGPDGVRILAPYEQAHPSQHPGVTTGDLAAAGTLFNLEADPSEQRNVAAGHPEEVRRLRALYDEMNAQAGG